MPLVISVFTKWGILPRMRLFSGQAIEYAQMTRRIGSSRRRKFCRFFYSMRCERALWPGSLLAKKFRSQSSSERFRGWSPVEKRYSLNRMCGPVAQRLEQGTHNPLVPGSNPGGPIKISDFEL